MWEILQQADEAGKSDRYWAFAHPHFRMSNAGARDQIVCFLSAREMRVASGRGRNEGGSSVITLCIMYVNIYFLQEEESNVSWMSDEEPTS